MRKNRQRSFSEKIMRKTKNFFILAALVTDFHQIVIIKHTFLWRGVAIYCCINMGHKHSPCSMRQSRANPLLYQLQLFSGAN